MVSGVAQVQVFGSQKYAVRAQLDPRALATRQIGIDEVARAIQGGNVNLPTGILSGPQSGRDRPRHRPIDGCSGYRPLIVAYRNGSPVRLGEIGRVIDSVENDKIASWYNGTRPSFWRSSVSRAPIPLRWWIRPEAFSDFPCQIPLRSTSISSMIAPCRSATRSMMSRSLSSSPSASSSWSFFFFFGTSPLR